jgi:hypothetical protein
MVDDSTDGVNPRPLRRFAHAGAGRLLQVLETGPKTWRQLERHGFFPEDAAAAAVSLVMGGEYRIRLGPLLVELETAPGEGGDQ